MRKRFIAFEADGPDDTEADPTITTPDATDVDPNAAAIDPPVDPALDASADPSTDLTGDGSTTDPPGETEEEEVDPDTPVELADTGDLEVDRLKKLTDAKDLKELKKNDAAEVVDNALGDVEIISTAIESLREAIQHGGQSATVKLAVGVLQRVRRDQGFDELPRVSLETYQTNVSMALEGLVSTLKAMFRAIISAIMRAIDWIKERFKEFFSKNALMADTTKRVTEMIVKQRQDNASLLNTALSKKLVNEDEYVQAPGLKSWLTYQGKQPGAGMKVQLYREDGSAARMVEPGYADAFGELLTIAKMHEFFGSDQAKKFCAVAPEIAQAIYDGQEYPSGAISFDPRKSIPEGARAMMHYEGYQCPSDAVLYVREGYLGSTSVAIQVAYESEPTTAQEHLDQMGRWKIDFRKEQVELTNGSLRYLYQDEIQAASKISIELSEEMKRAQRTIDLFKLDSDKLKRMLATMDGKFSSAMEGHTEQVRQFISLSQAVNAYIRNASMVLEGALPYCDNIQQAWVRYLYLTYAEDARTIRAASKL